MDSVFKQDSHGRIYDHATMELYCLALEDKIKEGWEIDKKYAMGRYTNDVRFYKRPIHIEVKLRRKRDRKNNQGKDASL